MHLLPHQDLCLVIAVACCLIGCEQPFDRTPPGFVDACHGGIENWKQNWVCSEKRQIVLLEGNEDDWLHLERILKDLGTNEQLKVFGGIEHTPGYIRSLGVQICSNDGLYLSVDDRVYANERSNRDLEEIIVVLRTYKDDFVWKPLAKRLETTLAQEWPGQVSVDYPAPRGNNRALPDSIETCEPEV